MGDVLVGVLGELFEGPLEVGCHETHFLLGVLGVGLCCLGDVGERYPILFHQTNQVFRQMLPRQIHLLNGMRQRKPFVYRHRRRRRIPRIEDHSGRLP